MALDQLLKELSKNPIYDYIALGKIEEVHEINQLEKEYIIARAFRYRNFFNEKPGNEILFKYIDQNKLLDLYPEYTKVYGPYVFSNEQLAEELLVLTVDENCILRAKTIYYKRAMLEIQEGKRLPPNKPVRDYLKLSDVINKSPIVNEKCYRSYLTEVTLTKSVEEKIKLVYKEYATAEIYLTYSKIENDVLICFYNKFKRGVSRFRYSVVYYASCILGRKLNDSEVLMFRNGRKTDIRDENMCVATKEQLHILKKERMLKEYGLDIDKLLDLYRHLGYNAVSNVTRYGGRLEHSHKGRARIRIYRTDGTKDHNLLLSRALKEVAENRILDDLEETVDHIDRNKFNDTLDNLRILPRDKHTAEDAIRKECRSSFCPLCQKEFEVNYEKFYKIVGKKINVFCSASCASKAKYKPFSEMLKPVPYPDNYFRYYLTDKATGGKIYLKSKSYKEALKEVDLMTFRLDNKD